MIEKLDGIRETVDFSENSSLKIYNNVETIPYPPHWHTPIEIIIPIENTYCVRCNHAAYYLNPGDIFIIASGTLHSIDSCPNGMRYILQVNFNVLNQFRDFEFILSLLFPCLLIPKDNTNNSYRNLYEIIFNIMEEYTSTDTLGEVLIYSKLIHLFVMIGRNYANLSSKYEISSGKQQKNTEKFLIVFDYINKYYSEDLTLDKIAAYAGFSKYHFSRLFKDFFGISFYKYLNKKRILSAQALLIDSSLSITEVANMCGYSSLSAFIRMFKLCQGCTPSEYRSLYIQ